MPDRSFFDVVLQQRACRAFSADDVPDELVLRCLQAATHAPSAENRQPWEFVVVRDPQVRAAIGGLMAQVWEQGARAHSAGRLPADLLADVSRGVDGGIASAPVLVVVCGHAGRGLPATLPASVFPAVQNLLLAAGALGLGSAMTTLALQRRGDLRSLLALPDDVEPMALTPLGWPATALGRPRRTPAAERTHREAYGRPW